MQIVNILPHAFVLIGDDAAKHMAHYFGHTGRAYTIDLESMLRMYRMLALRWRLKRRRPKVL